MGWPSVLPLAEAAAGAVETRHGLFILCAAEAPKAVGIPDEAGSHTSSISFGVLKRAQALGDRQALLDAGRNVMWFDLGSDQVRGLTRP